MSDLTGLQPLVSALSRAHSDAARTELINNFIIAVAYGARGFPIVEHGHIGAIWLGDGHERNVALAGDFNGFSQTATPMLQPIAGFAFYYCIAEIAEPRTRTLYKIVHSGGTYLADPLARRYGYDQYGQYSLAHADDTTSHLERWPHFASRSHGLAARDVLVYVPAGYASSSKPLRVLYMQDGQNLFDPSAPYGGWRAGQVADAQFSSHAASPFLIVAIPNSAARIDEYTPVTDADGNDIIGGAAACYVAFVVEGIKPFIDTRYRTATGVADTGIMGASLGGLVSVYAAWARPDVFGFAASMSGTMGWGSIELQHRTIMADFHAKPPPSSLHIYLDTGGHDGGLWLDADGDGVHDDNPAAKDNYSENMDFLVTLHDLGFVDGENLTYHWEPGAEHNEAAWSARLCRPFQLFGKP